MSRREDFDTAFWGDPEVRAFSPDARFVYVWSFTNDHQNLAGIYRLDIATVMLDTGLSRRRVERALNELEEGGHIVRHRHSIWVRSRVKKLGSKNPSNARRIAKILDELDPEDPLRFGFMEKYGKAKWLRGELSSIDVETAIPEPKVDTLSRQVVRAGAGAGAGKEEPPTISENGEDYSRDFADWLADHEQVTGMRAPREGTKARRELAASFAARRRERYPLEELKLATRGAFNDQHRRQHGYFDAESVLRPRKVAKLIEWGRRAGADLGLTAADRGVLDMLEEAKRLRGEDAA